jgi:hypothetical protein
MQGNGAGMQYMIVRHLSWLGVFSR